jgi:hypothetical protein
MHIYFLFTLMLTAFLTLTPCLWIHFFNGNSTNIFCISVTTRYSHTYEFGKFFFSKSK